MNALNHTNIVSFVQFKQARDRKTSRSIKMSVTQLESLVTTFRHLMQKARNDEDAAEYYRLGEELCLAEAALNSCSVHIAPLAFSCN